MKWLKANERPREQDASMHMEGGRGSPVMEQMAHEVYRVVLFGVFYLQVSLLGYVPYIGEPFASVRLSWGAFNCVSPHSSIDASSSMLRARLP